jgi:germination protein M
MAQKRLGRLLLIVATVVLVVSAAGCRQSGPGGDNSIDGADRDSRRQASPDSSTRSEPSTEPTTELRLYFSDRQAEKLVAEVRAIPQTDEVGRAAVEALIEGPAFEGAVPTMPEGTLLLGIQIEQGEATVNFSSELVDNHSGGSSGERMTVYSVVNTLTEFDTVSAVRFLVDGQKRDTIAGHMDISGPIERDESLL